MSGSDTSGGERSNFARNLSYWVNYKITKLAFKFAAFVGDHQSPRIEQ